MTFNKKIKKTWIFIIIIAIISIGTAIAYKSHNNKGFFTNKPKEITVSFDDFLIQNPSSNYDLYYKREPIKGLFVNASAAGSEERLSYLIDIANDTEINSFVIDIKEDGGRLTYDMNVPLADEIGAEHRYIRDIDVLMNKLYDNNIYPIARIVVFKDPYLSKNKIDYAIKNKDGSLWKYKNISWLNPYNEDTWEYVLDVAKEAVKVGFKEIQFDYIRFEATSYLKNADFGEIEKTETRREAILKFLDYAMKELEPYDVEVSADVFGTIITSEVDSRNIGQEYMEMAKRLDVICPMVYPSHYGFGFFGIPRNKHSDLYPYETIFGSMNESNKRYNDQKGVKLAVVRPWLQAFTASYLRSPNYKIYDKDAIRAQIKATYDAGLEEWLLWHAGSKYDKNVLLKE
jgi:hypothetical protein